MGLCRCEHGARELGGVGSADRNLSGARVEPAREEDVVDDPREPLRLARDHAEHPLLLVDAERDVLAAQRHRGAVDRGERRAQLVRDGRDEIALELLDRPLVGEVAERVDRALRELRGGEREPELAGGAVDRKRLRPLAGLLERPAGQDVGRVAPSDDHARRAR